MRSLTLALALAVVTACSPASSSTDGVATTATPVPRPAAAPACTAAAYRNLSPAFCVNLPAELRGKTPEARPDGIAFMGDHASVSISWVPVSDTKRVAGWKSLDAGPEMEGTFEVLALETLPRGTFSLVHDATQHRTIEIYKVPQLRGVTVVDDGTRAFRCAASISLEQDDDAAAIAKARAGFLAACKSIHLG